MQSLVRLSRGIWRDASSVDDLLGRASALLVACPNDSVITGVTAAMLYGRWLPPWLLADPTVFEAVVRCDEPELERRSHSTRPEISVRRQRLEQDDVTTFAGLPIVTEARMWVDFAPRLQPADLVALGDSILRAGSPLDALARAVQRARHRRGVVRARQVLPFLDARSRSRPESHLRFAIVSSGLPAPAVNAPVYDEHGGWVAEPDLSYDDVKLALEYNGADHADIRRMRRDITREGDVEMRGGWRMATFGPAQVFRYPDQTVSRIRMLRLAQSRAAGSAVSW